MDFTGKVAMVTGAAAHIGRATAVMLAQRGAALVLADYDAERLEETRVLVETQGAKVLALQCDVSDEKRVDEVVARAISQFGHIDILINNAGLWRSHWGPFAQSESRNWIEKINVNVLGTMYCTHAVLEGMIRQRYGRIVNLASVAGVYGNANMVDYSTTKGAIIAFTAALAKEVAEQGITVNAVSPGNVREDDGPDNLRLSHIPRSGTPQENAELICFLASDQAAYISGQNYLIDGCRKSM